MTDSEPIPSDSGSESDTESPTNIRESVLYRITVLHRVLTRMSQRYLSDNFDLTIAEWWVLGKLATQEPQTVRGLAEFTQMDKAQVSRAVDSLISKGAATREADPTDKRSVIFKVSDRGQEVFTMALRSRLVLHQQILDFLGPAEAPIFMDQLQSLIDHYAHADHPE